MSELRFMGPRLIGNEGYVGYDLDNTFAASQKISSKAECKALYEEIASDLSKGCGSDDEARRALLNFQLNYGKSRKGDYYRVSIEAVGFNAAIAIRDSVREDLPRRVAVAKLNAQVSQFEAEAEKLSDAGLLRHKGLFGSETAAFVACKLDEREYTKENVELMGLRGAVGF